MKRYISCLLTLALLVPAFVSCTEQLEDTRVPEKHLRTVYFSTSTPETKTGLSIEDNMVIPDWRGTELDDLHFFEIPASGGEALYGEAVAITTSEDNLTAHFKAGFSEDMTIHVPTKADTEGAGNFYGAVVAQKESGDDNFTFFIPAVQNPGEATLKDPRADFLVGYSRKAYAAADVSEEQVVDLYFDRVAALGRISLTEFQGEAEKVKSVTINTTEGLVGSATLANITWGDKNEVAFSRVTGPLTLAYGDAGADLLNDGAFKAYFVAVPGKATVTSIVVETDQYRYTKTIDGGKEITFSAEAFKNINVDLSTAEKEEVSSNVWYKASVLEAGYNYLIVSQNQVLKNDAGATAAVAVTPEDGIISFESATDPTIIWKATAHVEYYDEDDTKPAGHYTLSQGEGDAKKYLERYSNQQTQNGSIVSAPTEDTNGNFKYYVWEYDGEHFYQISRDGNDGVYCLTYNSGWKFEYQSKPNTYLYTNRPPVEISFASAEAKYDLDNGEWTVAIPELTAPEGSVVTYSSSDEEIATVAADGTVTPKAAGSVRITATVEGNDEHQGGSAYYELIVSTSKITTWYKAEEMVDGETYLIVSHEYVLENNAGTANAVKVDFSGDVIQYNAPATVLWEAKATSTSGVFTLQNNGQYLYRVSSGSTYGQTSYAPGASSSASSYYQWSYNSETDRISTTGNSTYFVYYSTNNSKWSMSTTEADHPAALYTSTPGLVSRNLKFSAETVTHDLADGEDVNEPELSGDSIEGVTYASENEQIATVNANTGAVTLTGKTGSVKITASFLKTDTYKAESVSYTLIVKNSALGPKTYRKVTVASDLVVGDQYLLVYEEGSKVFKPILDGTTFKKTSDNAQSVTISSSTITSDELEDNELTLKDGYYLYVSSADRYVYPEGGSGGTSLPAESTPSHKLTITINSNGTAKISSSDVANFTWSSSGYFSSTYQATTTFVVCLYKLDDGTTPTLTPQNLSFPEAAYTVQMGTSFTAPTVSGAKTSVMYASSNTSVATVNATTGAVILEGAGETTITASAPAGTVDGVSYEEGSASYKLTVTPAAGDMVTVQLKKATSLTAGKKYVLVSNGMALLKNGDDAGAVAFNSADLTISVPSSSRNDVEWTLVKKSGTITRGNEYAFTIGDYFFGIAMNTNVQTYTYTVEVSNGREVSSGISIQDHNVNLANDLIYYAGNSSNYYIYYDGTSWNNGKVGNSATPDASYKTALYVVDDGTVEPTTTYYLASIIEAGKEYVIVSNGKALLNDSGSAGATDVTVSDGKITVIEDNALLWKAEADGDNTFAFSNGSGNYLRRNSSNTGNIGIGAKSSSTYNNRWSYNSNNKRFMLPRSTTQTYYLYYNSGAWSIVENTEGDTQLFTTEPGSNPGGGDVDPTPTTTSYSRVSFATGISTGKYLIVNPADAQVFTTVTSYPNSASVTPSNGVISGDYASYEVTITKSGDNYTIQNASGQYLYYVFTSGDTETRVAYKSDTENWAVSSVSSDANGFDLNCSGGSGRQHIYWNNSTAGTFFKIGSQTSGIHLYKKAENP